MAALGPQLPSERFTSVASMSTHLPPWTVRTGSVYSRAVKVPSGSAKISLRSVRSPTTSVFLPLSCAAAMACCSVCIGWSAATGACA